MGFYVYGTEGVQPYSPGEIRRNRKVESVERTSGPGSVEGKGQDSDGDLAKERATQQYKKTAEQQLEERKPALLAKDIMRAPVFSISSKTSASEVREEFRARRFRHIPITDEAGIIVGVLSDRDILGINDLELEVSVLMHSPVLTAQADTPIHEVARVLFEERVGCLPVVDDRALIGIITRSDILRAVMQRAPLDLWT